MITVVPSQEATSLSSLELLYTISRELASALDLQTVLKQVLQLSSQFVGANSGSIIVLDSEGQPVGSTIIYRGQIHTQQTEQIRDTIDKGLAGWVLRHREAALIPDTSLDPRWTKRPDDSPEQTGAKSAVSAPLMVRHTLAGVLTLVHPTPNTFNDDQLALVRSIADQAGIAVLNAQLYTESLNRARVMSALAESSLAITAALGTDDILQRVLQQVHQALEVEAVSLALLTPDRKTLEIKEATGPVANEVRGWRLKIGEGVAGQVARTGKTIIIPDTSQDARFYARVDKSTGFQTRALACAPIRSRGKIIGVLEALNPLNRQFPHDTRLLLEGIGSLAGAVIEQRELMDNLKNARRRFQELFEDSIDPIVITDWTGKIIEANRPAVFVNRTPKAELLKMNIQQLHEIDQKKVGGPEFENLRDDIMVYYEATLRPAPDVEIPIEVNVRQIFFDNHGFLQWILRDITERKHLDTLRDDLISMIYHDLRSPLANVLYSMDILSSLLSGENGMYGTLIDVAVRSAERIQRLTSSLLDLKRLEAGQPVLNRDTTHLTEIINDAVDAVKPVAESKKQEVYTELPAELPTMNIDGDMIRRVIINLLENAIKYTPINGRIGVGANAFEGGVLFWVKDNGPGISPEKRDSIFDKFTRLHTSGRGIGLGLAFCRLAVEGHQGRIWVESEQGLGSVFLFTLPFHSS
ncbi:MAG: GAF domain-containing protein [Anaerolineales bacterium]|nr:GAF domain-containing protein [Anaerolineales bacterium]